MSMEARMSLSKCHKSIHSAHAQSWAKSPSFDGIHRICGRVNSMTILPWQQCFINHSQRKSRMSLCLSFNNLSLMRSSIKWGPDLYEILKFLLQVASDQCCSQDQAIRDQDQDQDHTPQDQDQDREVQDQDQKSETKTSNFRDQDQDQRVLN